MAVAFPAPQSMDPVEDHINYFFNHVIERAEHRRATLLTVAHEKRQYMAAKVIEREHGEEQLLSARADIEQHLRENFLQETQERLLAEIVQKLEVLRVPDTYLVFRGEYEQLDQLIDDVGEIFEKVVPVVPRYHDMKPIVAVAKKGRAPGELWNPRGVAIDPATNHIYVAEGGALTSFARISIFSDSGEYLNNYKHDHMSALWGIAIYGNDLYVTDNKEHSVFQLKIETDFRLVARLGGQGSGEGKFDEPRQLSISINGDVYIADEKNNRIVILDSTLHPIRKVTHQSMRKPRDVKLTPEELYVLSIEISPCVHVFNHTGQMTRALITCGDRMQVNGCHFFCLDAKYNLIISDWVNDQIRIFSNEGELIHMIGEIARQGKEEMFLRPNGLALTSNLNLVTVSSNKNHGLQILSSL